MTCGPSNIPITTIPIGASVAESSLYFLHPNKNPSLVFATTEWSQLPLIGSIYDGPPVEKQTWFRRWNYCNSRKICFQLFFVKEMSYDGGFTAYSLY